MNEISKRIIFGLIYVLLVVFATTFNQFTFFGLFFIFMLFCIYEFQKMLNYKSVFPYVIGVLLFTASVVKLSNSFSYMQQFAKSTLIEHLFKLSAVVAVFIAFISTLFLQKKEVHSFLGNIGLTLIYPILPFILLIQIPFYKDTFDNKIILGVFILIWMSDTFAYIIGRKFGKHKLFERISPKKTIEGFIGGFVFTLITAYISSLYFTNTSLVNWIVIAIIVSVFGSIGDLVESMFKREAKIKDSSNFIPGHGGFLDRLDSVIFAAPFIYVFLYATQYLNLFLNVS
ncbi:MAG: phosphatidate cytidylyltransferase [Flavobacteriaceae bacterium]